MGKWVGEYLIALVVLACGGKSGAVDLPPSAGATAASGAGGSFEAMGGAGLGGAPGSSNPVELIDDVDHAGGSSSGLPLPPGSSAFWWGANHLGNWFVYAPAPDELAEDARAAEIVPPRANSIKAYRVRGSGRGRGVDLWVQLDHPGGKAMDLSAYAGITFWARLDGASDRLVVGMNPGIQYFSAPDSVPSVTLAVRPDWEQFELRFEDFDIDGQQVAIFDFVAGEGGGMFDLWIDDLAFVCRNECPTYE
jgi:hypothetical protein